MTTKPKNSAAPLGIATDALAGLILSLIVSREAELLALVSEGLPGEEELKVPRGGAFARGHAMMVAGSLLAPAMRIAGPPSPSPLPDTGDWKEPE